MNNAAFWDVTPLRHSLESIYLNVSKTGNESSRGTRNGNLQLNFELRNVESLFVRMIPVFI
jgi:hypothetical protein